MADISIISSVNSEYSYKCISHAVAKATELGCRVSVAIVDQAGNILSLIRMDGAPIQSVQVAIDKAYTATGLGRPTHVWAERLQESETLRNSAPTAIPRFVAMAGGLPIVWEGAVVGGIGVSGASGEEDRRIAEDTISIQIRS